MSFTAMFYLLTCSGFISHLVPDFAQAYSGS